MNVNDLDFSVLKFSHNQFQEDIIELQEYV